MTAPIADAGTDQSYSHPYTMPYTVTLDGSGSYDPDGGAITSYQWYWIDKPPSSTASLSSSTVVNPTFQADVEGTYRLFLVVTDSGGEQSETDPTIANENAFVNIMFKTQENDLVKPASGQRNVGDYLNEWVDAIESNSGNLPTHASNVNEGIVYLSDAPSSPTHPEALGTNNVDWQYIKNVRDTNAKDTGFENRTDSNLSFDDATLTFNINVVGLSFAYWSRGQYFVKLANESITITDTEGRWYFYYDGATLTTGQTVWDESQGHVPIATIYWDATNKKHLSLEDCRFFLAMDWATKRNTRIAYAPIRRSDGLGYSYSWTYAGNLDSDAWITILDGKIINIDTEVTISNGSPQQLMPLQAPLFYWTPSGIRQLTATDFPVAYGYGSGRCAYNNTGTLTEMTDGYYSYTLLAITDDLEHPIIGIIGQKEYEFYDDILLELGVIYLTYYSNTPYFNYRPYGVIIFKTDSTYTNTPKAAFLDFKTYLNNFPLVVNSMSPNLNHYNLAGNEDRACHPDESIVFSKTSANITGLTSALNVEEAIDAIDAHVIHDAYQQEDNNYPVNLHNDWYDLGSTSVWASSYDSINHYWKIVADLSTAAVDKLLLDANLMQRFTGSTEGIRIKGFTIYYEIETNDIANELSLMIYKSNPNSGATYIDFGGTGGKAVLNKAVGTYNMVTFTTSTPLFLENEILVIEITADNNGGAASRLTISHFQIDYDYFF